MDDSGRLDPALDSYLVERCLTGDQKAWAMLVRRHERLVYAIARSYRLSEADLGDVFQDVFAALVKGLPRLRDSRTLCRWLASTTDRIARATALRTRREQARSVHVGEMLETLPADAAPVGADLEMLEEQARIRIALDQMPARCRRLLTALYYEDPTPAYAELARRWGVAIGSLGPTRARCIQRLRLLLGQLSVEGSGISAKAASTSADERSKEERAKRRMRAARPENRGQVPLTTELGR